MTCHPPANRDQWRDPLLSKPIPLSGGARVKGPSPYHGSQRNNWLDGKYKSMSNIQFSAQL